MSNYHLQDKNLSLKAKGLLSMMLSLPDGWHYNVRGLAAICKEGVSSISSTIRELDACGYIRRHQPIVDGKFQEIEYIIYETPQARKLSDEEDASRNADDSSTGGADSVSSNDPEPHTDMTCSGNSCTEIPCTENPHTGNPYTENPNTQNQHAYKRTKQEKTKKQNTHGLIGEQKVLLCWMTAEPGQNSGMSLIFRTPILESMAGLLFSGVWRNVTANRFYNI